MGCSEHTKKIKRLTKSIKPRRKGFGFIYRLVSNGKCTYVGQTVDLNRRLYEHLSTGKKFDSIAVSQCEIKELSNAEARLIVRLKPELNRSIPKCDAFVRITSIRDDICNMVLKCGIEPDYIDTGKKAIRYITAEKRSEILKVANDIISKAEST